VYLDTLKQKQTLADKIRQANARETDLELMRPVPDFAESAWKAWPKKFR
jgi:hypothetical protein